MKLIACCDKNWGLGKDGELLIRIPEDLKRFSELTSGHPVILGRKTLQTFPKGKPLPNRRNIILSRNSSYIVEGAEVCDSAERALELLGDSQDETFVIGGAEIYNLFLPYCTVAYITRLEEEYASDCRLADLDIDAAWKISESSEKLKYEDICYRYVTYTR